MRTYVLDLYRREVNHYLVSVEAESEEEAIAKLDSRDYCTEDTNWGVAAPDAMGVNATEHWELDEACKDGALPLVLFFGDKNYAVARYGQIQNAAQHFGMSFGIVHRAIVDHYHGRPTGDVVCVQPQSLPQFAAQAA